MSTPIPAPANDPSFFGVDPAVAQVWVALLGVIVSALIAWLAIRVSLQATRISEESTRIAEKAAEIAEQNRLDALRDSQRRSRREYYDAAVEYLENARTNLVATGTSEFPHVLKRMADLIDSESAYDIVDWIDHAHRTVSMLGHGTADILNAYDTVSLLFGRAGARWVRSGEFDEPLYTVPDP